MVVAWLWLDAGLAARDALNSTGGETAGDQLRGKLQSLHYFYDYELPKIRAWLQVVESRTLTCARMQEEWFAP